MSSQEAEDTAEADKLIDQAGKKQQARQDFQRAATEAARAKLMAEVSRTRLEQIHQHALSK